MSIYTFANDVRYNHMVNTLSQITNDRVLLKLAYVGFAEL